MTAEQIARALHAQLHNTGYPYLAPSVHRTEVFPRVELWNAKLPSAQVIICYDKPEQEHEAKIYALWFAQRMMVSNPPGSVVACVATHDLRVIVVD